MFNYITKKLNKILLHIVRAKFIYPNYLFVFNYFFIYIFTFIYFMIETSDNLINIYIQQLLVFNFLFTLLVKIFTDSFIVL